MTKKILITGATGFVGYHLAKHLLKDPGTQLTLVDNLWRSTVDAEYEELLKNPRAEFKQLDLVKPASYEQLGGPYDHIYHLAAVNGTDHFYSIPHEVLRINILSLFYILEWMREHNPNGKVLYTSSNEAYASNLEAFNQLPIPTPENVPLSISDPYNPRWSYGGSKLIGELILINYARAYNLRSIIVRPHNFYGPRSGYGHVIPQFIERIQARMDPFPIYGSKNTRSFGYIEDGVRAMAALMDKVETDGPEPHTYNLGGGEEISILDLANHLFELSGWTPEALDIKSAPPGSTDRRFPDTSKLRALIGTDHDTSLIEGLKKTLEWYHNNPRPAGSTTL